MREERRTFARFSRIQRLEHAVMFTSFIILAATGLPQKFSSAAISQSLINLFGGIDTTRQIHHLAAIVLLISAAFHIVAVGYRLYVKRARPAMLPVVKDVRDGITDLLHNLGQRRERSQGGRYTWMEKVEYWALAWGIVVMAITGFMLWNPIATTALLPGESIPAAKTAHGWEAVLAVLAVILWHFYGVHLRRFNKSMFTGTMPEHEMLDEHPLELADIKAGIEPRPVDPAAVRKRQRIYVPIAAVAGAVMMAGILWFMSFEQTAIVTVLRREETVQVFAPLTPTPLPTPRPTRTPRPTPAVVIADWASVGGLLERNCVICHNGTIAGMDLATYEGAIRGSESGPVIVPGDPANSLIVQKIEGGAHPGQLSPAELAALKAWIAAGAPREGAGTSGQPAAEVWVGGIDALVNERCGACHVEAQLGDLSLQTYAAALQGGERGPAIVPGDPEQSVLVQVQREGEHAGQLTQQELERIIAWIAAGAPEK